MFAFCVERFHMSEPTTSKRIWAARTAQRFPMILDMVTGGELHLSGIHLLAKHLTETNHQQVLEKAKHKTVRQIEQLIAEIAPKPDVLARIVTLPTRNQTRKAQQHPGHGAPAADKVRITAPSSARSEVAPLAPRRYKLQVTLSQESRDKLTELQELQRGGSHAFACSEPNQQAGKS